MNPYANRSFIITNPAAGQQKAEKLRRRLGAAFAARNAPFDMFATDYAGHAEPLAREAARLGYRNVCIVGGDGSLAEAANGLAGMDTPLALIPAGTANQVAQNLGIPIRLESAVDVALNGRVAPIDLGRIGDRAFALVAGAGYDAAIMNAATRELKERWGFGAYIYAGVSEALKATPRRFHIVADDLDFEIDAVTVMIANVGALYGKWLPFSMPLAPEPRSAWQDGLFEVVVLSPKGFPHFANIVWRAATKSFATNKSFLHFKTRTITIEADPPIEVQIDGDPAGMTPITAVADPGALRMMIPSG
ncbi:MAG: diacylglycerol kinase family protein [Longimicrobiales bacterium]